MKTCKTCKQLKDSSEFHKNGGGRIRPECSTCSSEYHRTRYLDNRESILQTIRNYRSTENGKRTVSEGKKKWLENHLNVRRANRLVQSHIRRGVLLRQPCEKCGTTEKVEAHHDSYEKSQWLVVRWLCRFHHEEFHKEVKYALQQKDKVACSAGD